MFHHAKSDEKYVTVVRDIKTGDVLSNPGCGGLVVGVNHSL